MCELTMQAYNADVSQRVDALERESLAITTQCDAICAQESPTIEDVRGVRSLVARQDAIVHELMALRGDAL